MFKKFIVLYLLFHLLECLNGLYNATQIEGIKLENKIAIPFACKKENQRTNLYLIFPRQDKPKYFKNYKSSKLYFIYSQTIFFNI